MGNGLIRELLGINGRDKEREAQMQQLEMQIKQAQLQKLMMPEPAAQPDPYKQMQAEELASKSAAKERLGALAQYGSERGYESITPELIQTMTALDPSSVPKLIEDKQKKELERKKSLNEMQSSYNSFMSGSNAALENIGQTMPDVDNWTSGIGSLLQYVPGTPARDLAAKLDTIKAAQFIESLSNLKNSSPNGASGLGSVTEREGQMLRSLIASVEQEQSPQQLSSNLQKLQEHILGTQSRVKDAYSRDVETLGGNASYLQEQRQKPTPEQAREILRQRRLMRQRQ